MKWELCVLPAACFLVLSTLSCWLLVGAQERHFHRYTDDALLTLKSHSPSSSSAPQRAAGVCKKSWLDLAGVSIVCQRGIYPCFTPRQQEAEDKRRQPERKLLQCLPSEGVAPGRTLLLLSLPVPEALLQNISGLRSW